MGGWLMGWSKGLRLGGQIASQHDDAFSFFDRDAMRNKPESYESLI